MLKNKRRVAGLFGLLAILAVFATLLPGGAAQAGRGGATSAAQSQAAIGYRLQKINTSLCLVARNTPGENPVQQVPCAGYADQYWSLANMGYDSDDNILYQIANSNSWKCLAARGTGESRALVTSCNSQWRDQLWTTEYVEDFGGGWRFRNVNSKLCLVVRTGNPEAVAVQSTCGNWSDQVFRFL
jgi:hypothetical protein